MPTKNGIYDTYFVIGVVNMKWLIIRGQYYM